VKVGDLVRCIDDDFYLKVGLVTKVELWQDPSNARNVGVDVQVIWGDGKTRLHDELELEIIVSEHKN
tara:strand:+ start:110 stop:310 length:201 start_codon:yes stop_codon:yes gene_type:complete